MFCSTHPKKQNKPAPAHYPTPTNHPPAVPPPPTLMKKAPQHQQQLGFVFSQAPSPAAQPLTASEPAMDQRVLERFEQHFSAILRRYHVKAESDISKYNQLKFRPSSAVTSPTTCAGCFAHRHQLTTDMVKLLYTRNTIYKALNLALCHEEPHLVLQMYTQLLGHSIFEIIEDLPTTVYRGVRYSDALGKLYRRNVGETIYFYNFTSTSRVESTAKDFAGDDGWILEITLHQGSRDCVADMRHISPIDEKEILISCNSGFKITKVRPAIRRIYLELVDQKNCPSINLCRAHA